MAALTAVLVLFLLPALWIILTSIRPAVEINASPPVWIPRKLTLEPFMELVGAGHTEKSVPFTAYLRNTLVVSLGSTILSLVVGTLAGYSFSKYPFRGSRTVFLSIMLLRAIPGIALSLPLFIIFARLGLVDTLVGLTLAFTAMNIPFTIWLMDGFFREIPKEIDEAAQIDGCSRWQSFLRVALPLTAPGLAASGIFSFLMAWGEFQIASVLSRTVASKPFTVGLFDFTMEFTIDWQGMTAMSVVMLIPSVVFVVLVQQQLVQGLSSGAVKR